MEKICYVCVSVQRCMDTGCFEIERIEVPWFLDDFIMRKEAARPTMS